MNFIDLHAKKVLFAFPVLLAVLPGFAPPIDSGSPPGVTGAPGEPTCAVCHTSFPVNSGTAQFSISGPVSLVGQSSITLRAAFPQIGTTRSGFSMTDRDGANQSSGTWDIIDRVNTKFTDGSTNYVTQTFAGSQNVHQWDVRWTPPRSLPSGPVTFYGAGNEGDNSNSPAGDYVYTASHKIYQASLTANSNTWPLGSLQPLTLQAPTRPGDDYVIALSDGTTPSSLGGALELPVDIGSPLFFAPFTLPSLFQGFVGTLDASGQATASVQIPPLPVLSGFTWYLAFATFTTPPGPVVPTEVSHAIRVELQ